MPKEIVARHRSPQFGHVFSGEGYSAGYYGYMWADVLTVDPAEAYRAFRGRDPDVAALMRDRGFPVPEEE
jgi:peptidyl-dipeptidase Dcp